MMAGGLYHPNSHLNVSHPAAPCPAPVLQAIIEMLLSVNAKPNKMDNFGSSALAEAARAGHDGIISVLQAKGARLGWDNATEVGRG